MRWRKKYPFALGEFKGDCERTVGPSMTQPDDAMSLKEILLRFASDRQVLDESRRHTGGYESEPGFDDPDLVKLRDGDLTEQQEHAEGVRERIREYQASVDAQKAAQSDPKVKPVLEDVGNDRPVKGKRMPSTEENASDDDEEAKRPKKRTKPDRNVED